MRAAAAEAAITTREFEPAPTNPHVDAVGSDYACSTSPDTRPDRPAYIETPRALDRSYRRTISTRMPPAE